MKRWGFPPENLYENRTDSDDLVETLVDDEHTLLGLLELRLDSDGVRVVPDERAVADEATTPEELVEVSEDVHVSTTVGVPRIDCLVHRNRDSADTATVVDGVAVMEAERESVDVDVGVVCVRDDELHTRIVLVLLGELGVQEQFEGIAHLGCDVNLLRDTSVVSCRADHHELVGAVLQHEVDTRLDVFHRTARRFDRAKATGLQQLLVDIA